MAHITIHGPAKLSGSIPVYGSKNAALPLIAASLLTSEKVEIQNIPPISDVARLLDILRSLRCKAEQKDTTVVVSAKNISNEDINNELVGKLRGSVLLLGALLGRTKHAKLPKPGGDIIGARPIDTHIDGFRQLGARIEEDSSMVTIDGTHMKAGTVVLKEFSVTATENMMLGAATLSGTTTIHIAAAEPHIVALGNLLTQMGARVEGAGTHTIRITGSSSLHGATTKNIQDMLEAGLFILLGSVTDSDITVEQVPTEDLLLFFKKLDDIGISYTISSNSSVRVKKSDLKSFTMQSLPYPGIATDLQAPFAVVASQATGSSLIHDPLYEDRFRHIFEMQKMGAKAVIADPHRVVVTGPTPLVGRTIPSLDIRAGATLIMAGLAASGTTTIEHAEIIDRGYANLVGRLKNLGADITYTP